MVGEESAGNAFSEKKEFPQHSSFEYSVNGMLSYGGFLLYNQEVPDSNLGYLD
jgi:hypothetical protein